MSLLTEKQIADILDILKVCGTTTQARDLEQWNEKQQPAQPLSQFEQKWSKEPIYVQEWDAKKQPLSQFEPDWSKAPDKAVRAVINFFWVGIDDFTLGFDRTFYVRPAPVITPHPHAALLAKYAEVAARRPDPWAEFEMRIGGSSEWVKCDIPISFQNYWEYRYIGETK